MVYAKFGGQTECIMGNWKIENVNISILTHTTSGLPVVFTTVAPVINV